MFMMATNKDINVVRQASFLGGSNVSLKSVTRRDHSLEQIIRDVISLIRRLVRLLSSCRSGDSTLQGDSPHSSIIQSLLNAIQSGLSWIGIDSKGVTQPLINISKNIGQLTGYTGIFDQPAVFRDDENANAVVDVPQSVRCIKFHNEDWVDNQSLFISSGHDEMDLLARLKIPARIHIINWNTTRVSGYNLIEIPVSPGECSVLEKDFSNLLVNSQLSYFSSFYGKYRGSLKYTVEVVCTSLHQGQLFITFNPYVWNKSAPITRDQCRTCPFTIIDINTTRRYEHIVPFLCESDYAECALPKTPLLYPQGTSLGTFYIFVQNPLVAPSTVANTVDINVYISAGDDFEFMEPYTMGNIQFPDVGVFQSDEGLSHDAVIPVVNNDLKVNANHSGVKVCCNVSSAETENILNRDYVLSSAVAWASSDAAGTQIMKVNLPHDFWSQDYATFGLYQYHQYQHLDFEVTIKVNPSRFHAGMLIAAWVPGYATSSDIAFGTLTQFQHCFIDLSGETVGRLIVPYSYYKRVMRTSTPLYGSVYIFVWNQLRTGADQPNNLYLTVMAKALSPYVGVKCVAQAALQGDAPDMRVSDAAQSTSQEIRIYPAQVGMNVSGYVRTNHMNVKDLLRRPDNVAIFVVKPTTVNRWHRIARIKAFAGKYHKAIASCYTYWTGTNKLWFVTDIGANSTYQFAVQYGSKAVSQKATIDTNIILQDPICFNGFCYVKMMERNSFVVEVPMYRSTPLVSTSRNASDFPNGVTIDESLIMPYIDLYLCSGSAISTSVTITVFHSVGDDFQLFLWRAMQATQITPQPLGDGLIPALTSNTGSGWTVSGTNIASSSQAYYAFDRNYSTSVSFNTQTGRALIITSTTGYELDAVGISYTCTGGIVSGTIYSETTLIKEFQLPITPSQGGTTLIDVPLTFVNENGQFIINFIGTVTGGISITEMQLYETPALGLLQGDIIDSFMEKCSGVLQTLKDCVDGVINTFAGLAIVGKVGKCLKKAMNGLQEFVISLIDFVCGSFLLFGCTERIAKSLGVLMIGKVFAGKVVPQLRKLPFEWQMDLSIMDNIKSFLVRVRDYVSNWTGYSVQHLLSFVQIRMEGKKDFDLILEVVLALLEYVLKGDKALYDYTCDMISVFVEKVDKADDDDVIGLIKMRSKIDRLSTRMPKERLPFIYSTYSKKLDVLIESANCKQEAKGAIPEPIGMYIYAKPGTGKSSVLCKILPALLMSEFQFEGGFDEFCVNTALDNEGRMDKYDGQPMAVFDEFGSNRDNNDVATVIQYISQFSASVQSALLAKKGKSFRSRLLLLLSNLDNIQAVASKVNNPEAMQRRFSQFSFKMEVRKGKFDLPTLYEKLSVENMTKTQLLNELDLIFEFYPLDILTGRTELKPVSFTYVYTKLVQVWRHKLLIFEQGEALYNRIAHMQNDDSDDEDNWSSASSGVDVVGSQDESILILSCYRCSKNSLSGQKDFVHMLMKDIEIKEKIEDYDIMNDLQLVYNEMKNDGVEPSDDENKYGFLLKKMDMIIEKKVKTSYPGLKQWLIGLGVAAVAVVAIVSIVKGIKMLLPSLTGVFQNGYSDNRWCIKPKEANEKTLAKVVLQGVNERHEKIRRNMRRLYIGDVAYQMCCLCIDNRTICVNRHFVLKAQKTKEPVYVSVHDESGNECGKQPIQLSNVLEIEGPMGVTDLCIVKLENCTVSKARSIRSFIPEKQQAGKVSAILLSNDSSKDLEGSVDMRWTSLKADVVYSACSAFGFHTRNGDCGRPYVMDSEKPLMGIHCAIKDDGSQTYLAPIYLDMLPPYDTVEMEEVSAYVRPRSVWWSHPITTYGTMQIGNSTLISSGSTKTEFVPIIRNGVVFKHEEWNSGMLPAKLNGMGPNGMFVKNAGKYAVSSDWPIPINVHNAVVKYWQTLIHQTEEEAFTNEEAINGSGLMKPLHWSTSAGWVKESFNEKGKNGIFEEDIQGHRIFTHKAKTVKLKMFDMTFVELLEQQKEMLEKGVVPFSPWFATLKDELRSRVKVEADKTRIFEIPGLDMTIHFRREFGQFLNYVKQHYGFRLCHGIGANKECEWKRYYQNLSEFSNYLDIDYGNYDGSVNEAAFFFFEALCNQFYPKNEKRQNARRALLHALGHAYVVVGNHTILTSQGNKSGNPMTDVFNSLTNNYILNCAICVLQRASGLMMDPSIYHNDMRVITYGDDVVMSVSDEVRAWFNLNLLQELMAKWGYNVTDGSKSTNLKWKGIEDLVFLKSRFVDLGKVVLCPMDKTSIYKELEWEKRGHQDCESEFIQRIQQTQQFMFHHGEKEYNKFVNELRQRGVAPHLLSMSWLDRLCNLSELQELAESEGSIKVLG